MSVIEDKWKAVNLPVENFQIIVQLGGFVADTEWMKFMAITCSTISKDLNETMTRVCEVLTSDPPGSNARIKFTVFKEIYMYLISQVEKMTSKKHAEDVCAYLEKEWV